MASATALTTTGHIAPVDEIINRESQRRRFVKTFESQRFISISYLYIYIYPLLYNKEETLATVVFIDS